MVLMKQLYYRCRGNQQLTYTSGNKTLLDRTRSVINILLVTNAQMAIGVVSDKRGILIWLCEVIPTDAIIECEICSTY